eukprot:TRINITY_DN11903_c0_g1_i1.p1 TRINITY_DN11903_c0_g1~~TRINITY_DN11903_c0_g1_i1.p1  ORF type:complete len:284 (+),score=30.65 TRINITY_DN11903_c0_g1_i1:184-1035(+)
MAAPALSTPFQPYVYQSPQASVTPFQILGGEAQVVQIMLKPEEKILARPGTMCYMSGSVQTEINLPVENNLLAAFLQWLVGKQLPTITFVNSGSRDGYIALAPPSAARILPVDLALFGGEIICQRDSYLCSISDVKVTALTTRRVRAGFLVAEGMYMHKLVGRGLAFITAGGSIVQKSLARGEIVVVDAGCVVAITSNIGLEVKYVGTLKLPFFGGDGLFHAHLTGPGVVFIQSLPFNRLAHRIARALPGSNMRDNPRVLIHLMLFFFVVYIMVLTPLILAEG